MWHEIPSYEELKKIKEEREFSLWFPLFGGFFRIKINEDGEHNIALDYLEQGFLSYLTYNFKTKYRFSHLYKFNKKNYNGLIRLYKEMLNKIISEANYELSKLESEVN